MWFDNGYLQKYDDTKNNKLHIKEWYRNNVLAREVMGIDSLGIIGFKEFFYSPTGNLVVEGVFNLEKQIYIKYWNNGFLHEKGFIFNTGLQKLGKWEEWYEDGHLKSEKFYDENTPNLKTGTWKYWNEKGELIKEEVYKHGELIDTKEYLPLDLKKN